MKHSAGGSTRKWKPKRVKQLVTMRAFSPLIKSTFLHMMFAQLVGRLCYYVFNIIVEMAYDLLNSALNAVFHVKMNAELETVQFYALIGVGIVWIVVCLLCRQSTSPQSQATLRKKKEGIADDVVAAVNAATDAGDSLAAWTALVLLAKLEIEIAQKKKDYSRNHINFMRLFNLNFNSAVYATFHVNGLRDRQHYVRFGSYLEPELSYVSCLLLFPVVMMALGCMMLFIYCDRVISIVFSVLFLIYGVIWIVMWRDQRDAELLVDDLYDVATGIADGELPCDTAVVCDASFPDNEQCEDDTKHEEHHQLLSL